MITWEIVWDILNKIAIIGTILGIPATIYGIFRILFESVVIYDMYTEPNKAGGETVVIGAYSRLEYRRGKKTNPLRKYHKKGFDWDSEHSWK